MGGWVVVGGGWLEGSLGGWVCGGMGGGGVHGGVDGWRVHVVGAYTYPPIKSYNVKIFNFMNTHPPIHQTYPKCHSVTIHILWMVHRVGGGGVGGWFEGSWGGCVCSCVGGGGVGGWRVHRLGAYTHPPMDSYNVKIFNFMNTHPPIHQTYPKFHSVTNIYFGRVHGVGGWVVGGLMGWVVGKFMGWVGVWWCGWCGWWWGAWWDGKLGSSWGGCIYSPTHEQLQCQNISFYKHSPTHQTYPKCHSITVHILTHK